MKKEIRNGAWRSVINLTRGGNCEGLYCEKYRANLLREPPADGALDNPFLYGMPILFPVNRIEGGRFVFRGREYAFPINEPKTGCHLHGELHGMPFAVKEESECALTCVYTAERGEYLGFPHAFQIEMEYRLDEGLYHRVTVTNLSREEMPIFLGFHTTFNTCFTAKSRGEDIRAFAAISEEYERNMAINYLPTGKKPAFDSVSCALAAGEFNPFEKKISRHYRGCGQMTLTDVEQGLRIVYENDEKYGFRLIYNGGNEGYICLEPQTCLANCPNAPFERSETGFDFLAEGESKTYRSKIFLEEL